MTPTQRKILDAMKREQFAAFTGEGARKQGFAILQAKAGGIIVRCYGTPEYFLKSHGWIERVEREARGVWYRITQAGREA